MDSIASLPEPIPPKRPSVSASLERREVRAERLIGLRVSEAELTGDLSERAAADLRFDDVRLSRLDLSATEAAGLVLTDALVSGGSWANLRATRGALTRAEIEDVRATGVDLSEATVTDVAFMSSRFDLASFRFATLERVVFDDCRLEEADFHGATLSSVRFERCNLTAASFSAARCERCEIRDCELTDLQGVECLRGTRMRWNDVLQLTTLLAGAAGISIVD
ncbi:MAG TPA: pentapeptide repeat-containing protein [Gaiellaceae bacterium]|nr:pentapeptide repeat-containing protein [Gaiellaceae bacterium]